MAGKMGGGCDCRGGAGDDVSLFAAMALFFFGVTVGGVIEIAVLLAHGLVTFR